MGLLWGTRRRARLEGHAADFCLLCRALRPFRIERISLRPQVLGIPLGARRHGGHLAHCLHCRSTIAPDLERFERLWPTPADLEVLVRETHPDIFERYAQRLLVEATIAREPAMLSPSLRHELICEALMAVNHEVHQRTLQSTIDGATLLAGLATAAIATWVIPALVPEAGARSDAQAVFLAGAGALVVYLLATADLRFLRRRIYPLLAESLAPLAPSRPEIEHALHRLLQRRLKVGATLTARTLLHWIDRRGGAAPEPRKGVLIAGRDAPAA